VLRHDLGGAVSQFPDTPNYRGLFAPSRAEADIVDLEVEGDTFFPQWDHTAFHLLSRREGIVDKRNRYPHAYLVYERVKTEK